jgi:DNA-directed RNA polymerase subunit RPC12/RpoP
MTNYYCEYCGHKSSNISNLTAGVCRKHPNGNMKGKHKLYEGNEKNKYTCKLCGSKNSSLAGLTSGMCRRHPDGNMKGNHQPAL